MASPCFLLTPLQGFDARDVGGAREKIFYYIRRYRDKKVIYFNGWSGFGVAPVLRSIEQELRSIKAKKTPPELCLDKIVYIDCSAWESKRVMQRKIAEELKLGPETMAVLDMQDEDDDFNGVDHGSRDVIPSVSQVIARTLVDKKFMMIFLNGSDDEVDVTRFGITPGYCDHIILWTFKRQSLTIHNRREEIGRKLRYTQVLLYTRSLASELTSSQFQSLLREEAANIVARQPWVRGIDLIMLMESCLYELFLQCSFHRITGFAWVAHAPNYWTCDGIIKAGDVTRQIIDRLHQEIRWVCDAPLLGSVFAKLMEDPEAPFFVFKDDISFPKKRPHHWVCVNSKNITAIDDTKDILESASSLFVAFEKSDNLQALPNGFLTHCSNLGVVILSWCAFSFISPPFLQCHRLRFLGLDHCTNVNTVGVENNTDYWVFLQSLWVLDLRYTEWDDILSEGKMEIMANLRELNIEGLMCWKLTSRVLRRLPYLQKLRIIKPTHEAKTTIDYYNSFVDKVDLEILDLSGNRDMENLPTSLSMAKSLEMLILDGCDGLENVVVPNGLPSSLRSFSFDGYGPATHWTSSLFKLHLESSEPKQLPHADNRDVKTSKISLQGCTQLENLFIRGLPNLVELDLSECPIKVLELTTMVADVPLLKRLFLLGYENLRAIIWASAAQDYKNELETVWISDLQKARSIWSKGSRSPPSFENLQHLHLRSCPRLQFVLPVWVASFPSLETLHIIHCGDLTHVFVLDEKYPEEIVTHGVPFPKLTTIHFHDLPKLQQICKVKVLAPKLKTIRIRGCFGLRRLPSLQGREPGLKKPTVEMEKDVWDALQWDGLAAGHHPNIFEPPVHSRYYRPRRLLRGTVLRYLLSQTCSAYRFAQTSIHIFQLCH